MKKIRFVALWITLLWMLSAVLSVSAQSGGGFELTWSTIESGGSTFSTGGGYTLAGTIGQTDAGQLQGGSYQLVGGFWIGGMAHSAIYLPLILR